MIENDATFTGKVTDAPCIAQKLFPHSEVWKKEFAVSASVTEKITERKRLLLNKWQETNRDPAPLMKVAVHIRTDYGRFLKTRFNLEYLPIKYYHNAFSYYRERFVIQNRKRIDKFIHN